MIKKTIKNILIFYGSVWVSFTVIGGLINVNMVKSLLATNDLIFILWSLFPFLFLFYRMIFNYKIKQTFYYLEKRNGDRLNLENGINWEKIFNNIESDFDFCKIYKIKDAFKNPFNLIQNMLLYEIDKVTKLEPRYIQNMAEHIFEWCGDDEKIYGYGYDCALNGANTKNCDFRIFSSSEKTKLWEEGHKQGKIDKENNYE